MDLPGIHSLGLRPLGSRGAVACARRKRAPALALANCAAIRLTHRLRHSLPTPAMLAGVDKLWSSTPIADP